MIQFGKNVLCGAAFCDLLIKTINTAGLTAPRRRLAYKV